MKLVLEWNSPVMEWDSWKCKEVPSKLDREYIWLSVGIKGLSEDASYEFLNDLQKAINEELESDYGETDFARCSGYGDTEENALYDVCGWHRDFGNVGEQKKEIVRTIRSVYKELKKQYEQQ